MQRFIATLILISIISTACFAQDECWEKRTKAHTFGVIVKTTPSDITNILNKSKTRWTNLMLSTQDVKDYFNQEATNKKGVSKWKQGTKLWIEENNKIIGCYDSDNQFLALLEPTASKTPVPNNISGASW